MKIQILTTALRAAAILGSLALPALALPTSPLAPAISRTTEATTVGWICDRSDSICGLDDAKMLSKPAKVDYDALYKSTAEYKKIRDEKIDPNSSEGIQLRQRAVDRIREKTDSIRTQNGYCSVWKAIRHQDGRAVPDITDQVKALL
jgi:hypothetical protein